uniref:Uncharacterized protein n=1 Tax=Ananas comosus var. bracteatus TaxID=296719 RepID=A0A6V7PQ77_ANACO|nr:unnamed protein product [Ananas comosus var. bracteatus]
MPLLLSSAYNPSRAHGLSPFNHLSGKEHSLWWIRPPVFVKCDEYRAINAICSMINRRPPADNPAPRAHRPHGSSCNQIDQPEFPASTVGVSTPSRRRSSGFRRDLVRWIRDFERNPRSPYLLVLVEVFLVGIILFSAAVFEAESVLIFGFYFRVGFLTLAFQSLFELDRDTLHTRLDSAHECHSGVRLVLSRWCRSCQLDLLSTDQLEWIEPDSRNGAGTGVFTVPGTGILTVPIWIGSDLTFPTVKPQVPAAASSADQDRGKGVAS